MEKEQIMKLLYEEQYDLLQKNGIEWWKSQEIIEEILENANEYFEHSVKDMDVGIFLQTFFKNMPKGAIKDKELARKIIEVAHCDDAEYAISEELKNDREIFVELVIHSVGYYGYIPSTLEEKTKNDYRIDQLVNLVASKVEVGSEYADYDERLSEQQFIELSQKIKELNEAIEALSKEIIETPIEEIPKDVQLQQRKPGRPLAKHVEEDVRRFEELFLNEEAIRKALETGSGQSYVRNDIGLDTFSHITCDEEHQIGTSMPHGNNLFGLNCHVKQDENGKFVYTLTLNQGVFQPTKTEWRLAKLDKYGRLGPDNGILDRWGASAVAFVPSQMEVSPDKSDTCVTMTREEVIENVSDFFSMTNEEVIRRYDIRGPHEHMLVNMIMLDAIYQQEQKNEGCGKIEYVIMPEEILYKGKNGKKYVMRKSLQQ